MSGDPLDFHNWWGEVVVRKRCYGIKWVVVMDDAEYPKLHRMVL